MGYNVQMDEIAENQARSLREDRLNAVAKEYGNLAHEKFPDSTPMKAVRHLVEEAVELRLAESGRHKHPPPMEAAAVFLVLCHYCLLEGINLGTAVWDEWERIKDKPVIFDPKSGFSRIVKG